MLTYTLRAYDEGGAFAFGATLKCPDRAFAIDKFTRMMRGRSAELLFGRQVIATCGAGRGRATLQPGRPERARATAGAMNLTPPSRNRIHTG